MTAYVILFRETPVTDPAAIEEYQRLARPKSPTPGLKALAAYGALTPLEGEAPDGVVLLEFPTVEAAKAWHSNPDYQVAMAHRHKAAKFRSVIVEGLAPAAG